MTPAPAAGPGDLWAKVAASSGIRDARIRSAFLEVPRALFVDGHPAAYEDRAIPLKFRDGRAVSTSSTPSIVAQMLHCLQPEPGMAVLEIGTGSGFTTALLAHLVGPTGRVTSIDIEDEMISRAAWILGKASLSGRVRLLCRDASAGAPEHGPFHSILCGAGISCLPETWIQQLAPQGRILLPLKLRGMDCMVRLQPCRGGLQGEVLGLCSFPPLRGPLLDPFHQPERLSDLEDLCSRARLQDRLEALSGRGGASRDFTFFLLLTSPAFHVWVTTSARELAGGRRTGVSGLFVGGNRYALLTGEEARYTDATMGHVLQDYVQQWLAEGTPALGDWSLRLGRDDSLQPGNGAHHFVLRGLQGPQLLSFVRKRKGGVGGERLASLRADTRLDR